MKVSFLNELSRMVTQLRKDIAVPETAHMVECIFADGDI